MGNVFHKDFIGPNNHAVTAATYTNIAARDADAAFQVAENIDKLVRVNSTPATYFSLSSLSPTVWVDLSFGSVNDTFQFITTGMAPAHSEGLLFYDNVRDTLAFYNAETDVTLNVGEEQWVFVRNTSGSTITLGQAVFISGATGGTPTIALAQADVFATAQTVGLAAHDIENNTNGYVTISGLVEGLNTNAFSAGDQLFLDAATAGALTAVSPSGENFFGFVGTVTTSSPTTGAILVRPNLVPFVTAGEAAQIQNINGATISTAQWGFLGAMDQGVATTDAVVVDSIGVSGLNAAPANASDTGTTGEVRFTADHIYVCTATDTWKRVAIATF